MGSTGSIFWGMIFGAIGAGYIMYGRRQQRAVPLISGIALCVIPYFVANAFLTVIIGIALMALPFFITY
ncbi:MAG: hypothetical protein NT045_00085 [Candidatus Aureabacteria bacterium]|nr:hypothetical protein [Candidatus Auribacterota bacterium]